MVDQALHELFTGFVSNSQDNECLDGVPFHRIRFADYRGLRYCLVRNKSALNLSGADIVAG